MTKSATNVQNNSLPTSGAATSMASGAAGPDTANIANLGMTSGGMRGLGIVAFVIAQIALKLETVKLAKDYYKTTKKDWDFIKATHQPGAVQSVSEAMSGTINPKYIPDLYVSSPAGMSKSKIIDKSWFATRRRMTRYATGAQRRVDYDFAVLRSGAIATGWNMGRRYEQAWADAHNERRFNRRLAMGNLGIAVGNIVRQGLATAVGELANAQGEMANVVGAIGNGYFEKAGYDDARKEARARYDAVTKQPENT